MKYIGLSLPACLLLVACHAPVHYDPFETNQVSDYVGLTAALKD